MNHVEKLRDPTAETSPTRRARLAPPPSLEGKTVARLNIPIIRRFLEDFSRVHGADIGKISVVNTQPSDSLTAFGKPLPAHVAAPCP